MEAREDEPAHAVADEERVFAGCEAHLRFGRRPHALHAPAVRRHDVFDRGGRVDRHRDHPRRQPDRERDERGQEMHIARYPPAIVYHEDFLATRVDDHAERGSERRDQHRQLTQLLLELFERS